MSDSTGKKDDVAPEETNIVPEHEEEHLEDEEKILAGRNDVNYQALLTKDVPGGSAGSACPNPPAH
jgi:hypothetical protein